MYYVATKSGNTWQQEGTEHQTWEAACTAAKDALLSSAGLSESRVLEVVGTFKKVQEIQSTVVPRYELDDHKMAS